MSVFILVPGLVALAAGLALVARHRRDLLPEAARRRLRWATVAAAPPALAGFLLFGSELVDAASPVPALTGAMLLLVPGLLFMMAAWASTRIPWSRGWPAALAIPLLLWVAVQGPTDGAWNWNVAMGSLGLLLAAVMLPRALAETSASPARAHRAAAGALGLTLALGTLLGAAFAFMNLAEGAIPEAEHAWSAHLEPSDDGVPYVVTVPFLEPGELEANPTLHRLADRVHVTEGTAHLAWVENGTALRVNATGPVSLEATYAFLGSTGHREAFNGYLVPAAAPLLEPGGPDHVQLTWRIDMTGGGGHTCHANQRLDLNLAPGEPAPLRNTTGDHDTEGRLQILCM